jgi:hypothetical protein
MAKGNSKKRKCRLSELIKGKKVTMQSVIKKKPKLFLCLIKHYAMKTYGGVEVQLPILDLGTVWRWVVRFTPRPPYPRDRRIGGWVDPRAGLDALEKINSCPRRESKPGRPARRYTD